MRLKHINFRRWLLTVFAMPAILATGQPAADTIPEPQNQFSVDLQFLGRGETRYGGLPAVPIEVDEDNVIRQVAFDGGCNGNTKGVAALVKGMKAAEVIDRLEHIRCGLKSTSCPDQLAKALKEIVAQNR